MTVSQTPYDRGAKLLSRVRPADFLALIFPSIDPAAIRIEDADLTLPDKRSDHLFILDTERVVACLEFMIAPDPRVLRSWLLKTAIVADRWEAWQVMLAVFYLTRDGYTTVPNTVVLCKGGRTELRFTAVALWEHREAIEKGRYPALVPFLSLWSGKDRKVLGQVRELILREPDPKVRADLMSIAVMVAGRVFKDRQWLLKYFREEWTMLKESWVVDEWIKEGIERGIQQGRDEGWKEGMEKGMEKGREEGMEKGREEGMEKGRLAGLHQSVLSALSARFEVVPRDVLRTLAEISEPDVMAHIFALALRAESLEELRSKLSQILAEPE